MGHGHALWLLPEAAAFARLSAIIAEIARSEGSPAFAPHVTLLSRIALGRADVIARARALARTLTPRDVLLARAVQGPEFFQALFLEVEGGDLLGAQRRAGEVMGMTSPTEYRPHLSLLYGDRSAAAKSAILDRVGRDWNEPCLLDRLAVVRPEGPADSWTRDLTVPLREP